MVAPSEQPPAAEQDILSVVDRLYQEVMSVGTAYTCDEYGQLVRSRDGVNFDVARAIVRTDTSGQGALVADGSLESVVNYRVQMQSPRGKARFGGDLLGSFAQALPSPDGATNNYEVHEDGTVTVQRTSLDGQPMPPRQLNPAELADFTQRLATGVVVITLDLD